MTGSDEILTVEPNLALNVRTRRARCGVLWATLKVADAAVFEDLMRNPHRVVSYQELIDQQLPGAWTVRLVQTRVEMLRRALGSQVIWNVRGVGYQLGRAEEGTPLVLQAGTLTLRDARLLTHGDLGQVRLMPREGSFAQCLLAHAGTVASDDVLMRTAKIDPDHVPRYRAAMARLRCKFRAIGADELLVRVGRGYRLAAGRGRLRRVARLELDFDARAVRLRGRPLARRPAWFAVLDRLTVMPDRLVARADLVAHATGGDAEFHAAMAELELVVASIEPGLIERRDDGYRIAIERFGLLAVGSLVLDQVAGCARFDTREVQLEPSESGVLEALMRTHTIGVTRLQLLEASGTETWKGLHMVMVRLRRKLRQLTEVPLIAPLKGTGHRLAVEQLDVDLLDWPLRFGGVRFRPSTRQLACDMRPGTIGPKPGVMFEALMRVDGAVVGDDALIQAIWGGDVPGHAALKACAQSLQTALDRVDAPLAVERVGRGYRLRCLDVTVLDWPVEFAGLRFRPDDRQLLCGERKGRASPKAGVMLEQLLRAQGAVVADETLIEAIWSETPNRTALSMCKAMAQRALDEVGCPHTVVRVRGVGYRLRVEHPAQPIH